MPDAMGIMFLRVNNRRKDGKDHRYYSVVENRRVRGGKHVQKTLLYLGEINDTQKAAWTRTIDTIDERGHRQVALFPEDREIPDGVDLGVQVRLTELQLHRPRQWGACWLACELWDQLELGEFWRQRLPASRKGTEWLHVLQTLTCYRLIDPGSEWRLHRYWFDHSAMADLLGEDFKIAQKDTLYRCHDRLVQHKEDLFKHLKGRWESLFDARCEVLLYDLTSTYFESDPPFEGKRQFGYSRDKRSDCVQVVIALVVTPDGFPLGYEVMAGNTADNTTLRGFLEKIERQHGKAQRVWVMDRGIPTEEVLAEMRSASTPVYYLVGTPKGRLSRYEDALTEQPWKTVREDVSVKLLEDGDEVYVYAQSEDRIQKERAMRKRRLQHLIRTLKAMRHQKEGRIEAHIFVAFLAYCLHVTLKQRCKQQATGLTPRSVLEQLKAMQMIDVSMPTVDGRWLNMSRYTQPDKAQQLLLAQLHLVLPPQSPPTISHAQFKSSCGGDP